MTASVHLLTHAEALQAMRDLFAMQEALQAELAIIEQKLSLFECTHEDAWYAAMDEDFHRVSARLHARLAGGSS